MSERVIYDAEHLLVAEANADEWAIGIELTRQGSTRAVTVGLWSWFVILRWTL